MYKGLIKTTGRFARNNATPETRRERTQNKPSIIGPCVKQSTNLFKENQQRYSRGTSKERPYIHESQRQELPARNRPQTVDHKGNMALSQKPLRHK